MVKKKQQELRGERSFVTTKVGKCLNKEEKMRKKLKKRSTNTIKHREWLLKLKSLCFFL